MKREVEELLPTSYSNIVPPHKVDPRLPSSVENMAQVGAGSDSLVYRNGPREVRKEPRPGYNDDDEQDIRDNYQRELNFHKVLQRYGNGPFFSLVKCVNFDFPDGIIYLEYFSGGDLARRIRDTSRPVSVGRKLLWIQELARGVAFISSIGYVHGDLRLDNLLLNESEHAKLCDFGATVRVGEDLKAFHVPFWNGDCDIASHESEQFALASCLYHIITGSEPYAELDSDEAKRVSKTINLFRESHYPQVDGSRLDVFAPLQSVLLKGWRRNYDSIEAMHKEIVTECSAIANAEKWK